MANHQNKGPEKDLRPANGLNGQSYDLDADLIRLKKSSYVLIALLIVLVAAFFILMILSLSGTFELQDEAKLPSALKIVHPLTDGVPVYRDPSVEMEPIATLKMSDRVFEIKRIPGWVRVEWEDRSGWVESERVKSRLESATAAAGLSGSSLEVVWEFEAYQKDILISGKIVNRSDKALKNIHLVVSLLDSRREPVTVEQETLSTQTPLMPGAADPFNLAGRGVLGRASFIVYEVMALELVDSQAMAPSDEATGEPPAKPAAAKP